MKQKGNGYDIAVVAGLLIKPFKNLHFAYNFKYIPDINYDLTLKNMENLVELNIDPTITGSNDIIKT